MKRALAGPLLVVALALTVAAPASAKEITGAEICGADGCRTLAVPVGLHDFPGGGGGSGLAETPPFGPFVEVRLEYDGGQHRESVWYVPAANVFAMPDGYGSVRWMPVREEKLDELLVSAAAAIAPHRPRVTQAYVDAKPVPGDASGYAVLFGVASAGAERDLGEEFANVSLYTSPDSPWASTRLWFYPERGLLQRGIELIELPRAIAADVRAGRPIDSPAGTSSRGFDWPLVTGSLLVAALLGASVLLLSRRSRHVPA